MIGYGAVLRLNLFFGKRRYINVLSNSYIQVSHYKVHTETYKQHQVRSLRIRSLKVNLLLNMALFLNTICLKALKMGINSTKS